jgi:hypothetical protein
MFLTRLILALMVVFLILTALRIFLGRRKRR